MAKIQIRTLGLKGVNLDKDPLQLDVDELRYAQNAISEPLGALSGVKNRPGLGAFTPDDANASILGGIGVLAPNGAANGDGFLFLGRGGTFS